MPLVTMTDAALAYGHVALLDHIEFQLDEGERVALIGRNGSGKSSLLRCIAGQTMLDSGELWRASHVRTAYVPQEADFSLDQSVFDAIAGGLGPLAGQLHRYQQLTMEIGEHTTDAELAELDELQHAIDQQSGWIMQQRVTQVLQAINLTGEELVSDLSGGGVKRVALARALITEPEVLLLDEPTNHLDLEGIDWLESLVTKFNGALILITHDRYFLDKVATRIVELDRGKLTSYPAGFDDYQRRKAEFLEAEAREQARFDKFLAEEEVWIRKGVEARRTRNEGRVRRLHSLREARAERRNLQGQVNLALDRGEKSGQLIAELIDVSKRFDNKAIIANFSTRIKRGDKIGIIGPNGAGKTTLLKLILGELEADSGEIRRGTKQSVAYYDQLRAQLDPEATLTEVISPGSDFVEIGDQRKHVMSYLGDFLFSPQRARSPVKSLSGGERNRLLLARLFARPANVLVLDEPTNDLDIETLELLEELLDQYPGTLFLVSHDRRFLDNVVTQVIAAEGDGRWQESVGGYEDWMQYKQNRKNSSKAADNISDNNKGKSTGKNNRDKTRKLSFTQQHELDALPADINVIEDQLAELTEAMAAPELYGSGGEAVRGLAEKIAELESLLSIKMARWEALEALNS